MLLSPRGASGRFGKKTVRGSELRNYIKMSGHDLNFGSVEAFSALQASKKLMPTISLRQDFRIPNIGRSTLLHVVAFGR